ncbi:MAG: tRNA pseudouridine(38-40) synthase TruA [Cellulosilyticaceae bacterium]
MHHYKMIISYDGSKYMGWQRQSTSPLKTIQGKLEHVLSLLFDEPIQVIASGRTDAGVHALKQVANFHSHALKSPEEIVAYLKQYLPKDIAIVSLTSASPRFHARYNCTTKTYMYRIDTGEFANPFMLKYAYHIGQPLDTSAIEEAIQYLLGTHDFQSFTSMKSKKKSTIKTIQSITISKENDLYTLTYTGNGFLQHMVRILTGTLIDVGLGNLKASEIPRILDGKSRPLSGPTAPAHGLCLKEVNYD